MPDLLQILNDYLVEKVKKVGDVGFTLSLPSDFIEHVAKFYLEPYLSEPEVKFEGQALKITGYNVLKVEITVSVDDIVWDEKRKEVHLSVNTNELVWKFLDSPLDALEQKTKGIIRKNNRIIVVDIEKLFNLNPKWSSATYSARNLLKLSKISLSQEKVELIFEKA